MCIRDSGCADGIGVGEELLHAAGAFDAEISRGHLHGKGEIALHGELPGLRVADAEVGVHSVGVSAGAVSYTHLYWNLPVAYALCLGGWGE